MPGPDFVPQRRLNRLLDTNYPICLLVMVCTLLWLPGFFTLPPSDRDEARFVQASKQMLESGDFVSIHNGIVARNQKPIGIYWLQVPFAAAARAVGLAERNPVWPYRLPSLLGGIVAVCATQRLGAALVGRRAGLLGALMLAASLLLTVETHIAKTDAALLAATTLAMGWLARAYITPESLARPRWVGFWLALGAGILIKGPLTPLVVGLTIVTLLVVDRNWGGRPADETINNGSWLSRLRPRVGLPLLLLVVLPWFIAIGLRTHGAFFGQSVGGDLAGKLAGGDDAHGAPPGTHLLLLSFTLFPSAWVALAALPVVWRARRLPAMRFLLAWMIPAWLLFEAVPTKLPHYPLPLMPALCLIGAAWVLDPRFGRPIWLHRLTLGLSVLTAGVIGVGAAALPAVVGAGPGWRLLLGVPALLSAGLIALLSLRRGLPPALLATPLLTWSLLGFELPALHELWLAPRVSAVLAQTWPHGVRFAAAGFAEPSLMFLCGTGTTLLANGADAARFLNVATPPGGPPNVVLVERGERGRFAAAAKQLGMTPRLVAELAGFNYSRGKHVDLLIFVDIPSK